MEEVLCARCGKCCWDWKGNDPKNKCEHLADDMKTCLIHDRLAELRPECLDFPKPHMVVDLPPECPYIGKWKKEGLLDAVLS
jgi:uncharacterized cysteine cluster protein YcgN (CxxCxxCC family)